MIRSAHGTVLVVVALTLGVVALGVLALQTGRVALSVDHVLAALRGEPVEPFHRTIVWDLRLPRALIAATAGAVFALAGATLQAVSRNPLAEPGLIGVSGGAVFAVLFWLVVATPAGAPPAALPGVAILGGVLAGAASSLLSWRRRLDSTHALLLGVLVGGVLASANSILLILSNQSFGAIVTWLIGSTNGRTWIHWNSLWPIALALVPVAVLSARVANLLWLGDDLARGRGLAVREARAILFLVAGALASGAVATVGAIGFVGLVAPHIGRILVGDDCRRLFLLAPLVGAALLLGADLLVQAVVLEPPVRGLSAPAQLPVGVYLAVLGVGVFLALVARESRR